MLKPETSSEPLFATYANLPDGSTLIEFGAFPAATGAPMLVSTPVTALIVYIQTSSDVKCAT